MATRTKTFASSMLVLATLATSPALAQAVPYKGTSAADSIIFLRHLKAWSIDGLGGNDLIVGGHARDTIKGGDGRDTIDGFYASDVLYGGTGNDYFRYETTYDGIRGFSGHDVVADFKGGDKIDFYISWLDGEGGRDSVSGGNFKLFDTNKDGLINGKDAYSSIKKVKLDGKTRSSLVVDFHKAFADDDPPQGSLTIFGVTSLKREAFVLDYERDTPYYGLGPCCYQPIP